MSNDQAVNLINKAQEALGAALASLGVPDQGGSPSVDSGASETVLELTSSGSVKLKRVAEYKASLQAAGDPIANEVWDFYFIEETPNLNSTQKLNVSQNCSNALMMSGMMGKLKSADPLWPQGCEYNLAYDYGFWSKPTPGKPLASTASLPASNKDAQGNVVYQSLKTNDVLGCVKAYVERRHQEGGSPGAPFVPGEK